MSLEPLLRASPVIQVHAICAILAFVLGAVQLFRRKGDPVHRGLGAVWVGLMAAVAGSGLFIWTIRVWGPFSPIHLLSILTLALLWRGVDAARRHDVDTHLKTMRATYFFALIVAGILTFLPGRIMYHVAFGPAGATPLKLAAFAAAAVGLAFLAILMMRWRATEQGQAFVATH